MRPPAVVAQIVLWGDEHTSLGGRSVESPIPQVSIGLSAGIRKKSYAHTDPNEDAVAVSLTPDSTLVILADGHNGMASTRAAVSVVLERLGAVLAPAEISDQDLIDLWTEAGERVRADAKAAGQPQSRTTLIVVLIAGGLARWAAMGDSMLATVSARGDVTMLSERHSWFVGYPMTGDEVDARLARGVAELSDGSWLLAASDGLTDFVSGLKHTLVDATAGRARAAAVVEQLIDAAFAGNAGDNVAIAAVRADLSLHTIATSSPATAAALDSRDMRTRGCLIGGAVGDALGAAVEFLSITQIRQRFGPKGVTEYEPAYGHTGAITDDTQMTLFTAEGLMRSWVGGNTKGIKPDVVSVLDNAYLRWLKTQGETSERNAGASFDGWLFSEKGLHHRRAPGNTCLSALRAARAGTIAEPINNSKGCGGVMRIAPVGLCGDTFGPDVFTVACEIAALTHGHPSGYLAAGTLAEIVHGLVADDLPLPEALDRAQNRLSEHPGHEETLTALRAARDLAASGPVPTPETVATLGEGWVAEEALAIAVYCALVSEDFTHGVLLAVNHSGDSDSTGAITGNILGAIHGYGAIPIPLVFGLDLHGVVEMVCRDWNTLFVFTPTPDIFDPLNINTDRTWSERYPGH
jgi:ADP-ribosylglycohydrolase/serine/threonine protein phosphatase PrpC